MKSLRWLCAYALALSSIPSLAWGDDTSLADWAQQRVDDGLLRPLAEKEGSRFSRSRPPPRERRIQIPQLTASLDKKGRAFVPFAVDVRFGSEWRKNDIVGCVYRDTGDLFVKRGDAYRPAAFLLGKNLAPVAGVCVAAPSRS